MVATSLRELAGRSPHDRHRRLQRRTGRGAVLGDIESGPARPADLICTTTCAPDEIIRLAGARGERRHSLRRGADIRHQRRGRDGTATALVAGDDGAIDAVGALLDILCPRRIRDRQRSATPAATKLAINLILQNNRAALAEGIVFAERMGLDGQAFLAAARQSAAYSRVMDTKGEKMLSAGFSAAVAYLADPEGRRTDPRRKPGDRVCVCRLPRPRPNCCARPSRSRGRTATAPPLSRRSGSGPLRRRFPDDPRRHRRPRPLGPQSRRGLARPRRG